MRVHRLRAWGVPAGAVLALLSGLASRPAGAQGAAPGGGDGKNYTNRTVFDLPISIDQRARGTLQKVVLYVKEGQGAWAPTEPVSPMQEKFRYRVPHDGEFWFSVATVDQAGKQTPADVSRDPPGLMVVVDTQPPTFEVQLATLPGGQPALRCIVHDNVQPNYQGTRAAYKAPDGNLRPLEAVPGQPGLFRLPGPEALGGMVQVTAADRAGNQATREINLRDLTAQAPVGASGVQLANHQTVAPMAPLSAQALTPTPGALPASPPPGERMHTSARPAMMPTPAFERGGPSMPTLPSPSPTAEQPRQPAGGPSPAQAGMSARQVINTKHASIEYRVDPVGPSGIGKVEIWMTSDKGASWQRLGEDLDRRTPAEIDLPGEGLYGIRLAVCNGNGFGGAPPAPGDSAHSWIEVDTTPPTVQLHNIEPATHDGKLEIRWVVTDKNLANDAISLYYATKGGGPWQPIARKVANDGSYQWAFPHDAGNQFYVRLEAVDQAGNVANRETPNPIVLDMTEPHALVVGVTGGGTSPPRGN